MNKIKLIILALMFFTGYSCSKTSSDDSGSHNASEEAMDVANEDDWEDLDEENEEDWEDLDAEEMEEADGLQEDSIEEDF